MLSNQLIPPPSSLSDFNFSQHQGLLSHESALCIRWPKNGPSPSPSVLPTNIQGWSPSELTGLILQSKGLSRVFSRTTIWKHQFFCAQPFIWSNSHIHTWLREKIIWTDYTDFCWQSNISSFQHTVQICYSFPSKDQVFFSFMAVLTVCSDLESKVNWYAVENKMLYFLLNSSRWFKTLGRGAWLI